MQCSGEGDGGASSSHDSRSPDLLHLYLGVKDEFRAPPIAWEYLGVRDLVNVRLLSRSLRGRLDRVEYTRCRDGRDYLVPYPGFPGLLSTSRDLRMGSGLFRHQLASLEAMHRAENPEQDSGERIPFDALRGGILGDAPGLGKTITMLALIASTAGIRPVNPPEFWDEVGIQEGWKSLRCNEAFRENVLSALKPIRSWVNTYGQLKPACPPAFNDLARYVSPPYPDDRLPTLRHFERHVHRTLGSWVPQSEFELFRQNLVNLKASLDKRNRKILCSEKGRRFTWERRLIRSSATLIVVPDALLEHWFAQVSLHLNLERFVDEKENQSGDDDVASGPRGVVYLDGIGDLADARIPLCQGSFKGHVEPAWHLSKYLIVVTTFSRCESEFRKEVAAGRLAGTKRRGGRRNGSKRRRRAVEVLGASDECSPLLRMRWLRLVVDEGHELGTHEAGSDVTRFINEVAAERRWVLSGTPTTGDEDDMDFSAKSLDQFQRLLFFLRHPVYGQIPSLASDSSAPVEEWLRRDDSDDDDNATQCDVKARAQFGKMIKKPFLGKMEHGRQELLRLLREVMVMHRKEDIKLPKPVFRQAEVDVAIPDAVQEIIRNGAEESNSVFFSNYLESTEFQILVDQAQGEYIAKTIRSAQGSLLERGGRLEAGDAPLEAVREYSGTDAPLDRRPIKAVVYSSEKNNLLSVAEHLYEELSAENIAEMYGGIGDMSAELSRFRFGFKESRKCPVCKQWNDMGGDRRRADRCQQTLLEVTALDSQQTRFLIERERICRALSPGEYGGNVPTNRLEGDPLSTYGAHQKLWMTGDALEVDIRDPHPLLPARECEDIWDEWNVDECKERAALDNYEGKDWYFGPLPVTGPSGRIPVRLAKWQACGTFHNHARWYDGPRMVDSPVEVVKEDVFVLCLDATLAHGLDLSFVTHLFLLEPIDDAALLEQVTSRAHRLGATGPVTVETVNTLYKLSPDTEHALKQEKESATSACSTEQVVATATVKSMDKSLKRVVCQYCYRQFDSIAIAEEHEQTNCPRNPENISVVDPFHLSSVYREIRPPPPLKAETVE